MTSLRVPREVAEADQAQAHAASAPLATAGMSVAVSVLGVALWPVVAHGPLVTWLASLLLPFYVRTALTVAHHHGPDRLTAPAWIRAFRFTFLAHGLAWAVGALFIAGPLDVADRALLGFVVAGVTASALSTSAFDLTACLTVLLVAVVPWSVRLVVGGGRVQITIGGMLALFVVYMTSNARQVHRRYRENVALRYDAATRASALAGFQAAFARLWQSGPDVVVRAVTQEVAAGLRLRRACLFRFDDAAGVARLEATADDSAPPGPFAVPLAAMPRYLAALATHGRLVWNGVTPTDTYRELALTPMAPLPDCARLDVPFGSASHVAGVLCCERAAGAWSHDEVAFALTAAATLQAAAEDARRREAERRLRDLNQNLEALVAARTSALAESASRLALTLDATNDGVWDFNLDTGAVYFSPVWARLLGYAPEELVPSLDTFWSVVHPDDAPRVQHTLDRHIRGELPAKELEVRLRMKTGEYRWFLDQGKIVERDAAGRPRRMLGTITDITARKQALEDLHESELRFRALFDKSPMIVTLVDVSTSLIAEINEVGLRTFGFAREDAIGRTTIEAGVWADPRDRERFAQQLLAAGTVSGMEVEFRRKDGQRFWGLLSAALVTFHGKPFALSSTLDVTERRELEGRVRQAQKMEVVGHLAGGVAHDFNNVLTVITSTAELALPATRDGDVVHEALHTIRDASTRAARLTGQLLAFSRQQILQPALVDLNELVTGLVPMVRRVVGETTVLDAQTAGEPVTVLVDRGSLEQVVLNIALNARDAMPDGGALTVAVRTVRLEGDGLPALAPGRYAALSVTDTGSGMPEAVRQRIFEPFFTTKPVGKGTGLGLAMVHGVVQQSGGDVTVQSAPGTGSTFTVYLPLAAGAPARAAVESRAVPAGHETVLVVDDDPDIRQVVRRALSYAGYDVLLADSGEAALQTLESREGRVDLVLTDVMMPGIGGRELASRVRARHPAARILFSSGYAENAIAHHGVLAEGVQFIAKPYSLRALTAKVREALDATSRP